MPKKHALPDFLQNVVSQEAYSKWLHRKAQAHVRRDRKRGCVCSSSVYKDAIHLAVLSSDGRDAYTGEQLDWTLIGTYRNEDSKTGRHSYKTGFALLPTIDHAIAHATDINFKICAWQTNDVKNDLSHESLVEFAEKILLHAGYKVENPNR